jgi:hypothetical protein
LSATGGLFYELVFIFAAKLSQVWEREKEGGEIRKAECFEQGKIEIFYSV